MRVLLDTHALLWWLRGNRGLPANVLAVLAQTGNSITVSAASGWEISTKFRLGKLAVPRLLAEDLQTVASQNGWTVLPVTMGHAQLAGLLKGNHKDPFDRMLAAQSLLENMPLITNDPAFTEFHVKTFW
ncbi:MAG: type II toxin-antitoxin system VapC family toxin [Rhodomicrobium sp.]